MTENPYFLARNVSPDGFPTASVPMEHFVVTRDTCDTFEHFEPHRHDTDELMWIRSGRLDLHLADGRRFSLHREHMAWMPAQTAHEATLVGACELLCVFTTPTHRPRQSRWHTPRILATTALTGHLIQHLRDTDRPRPERLQCHALLTTLLETTPTHSDALAMPLDPRASRIAEAVMTDPSDTRTLDELAQSAGTSSRTLSRIFANETGLSFGKWRTRARLDHSLTLLAHGRSVETTAAAVGYATTSSYIESFKIRFGSTPAVYRKEFLNNTQLDRHGAH